MAPNLIDLRWSHDPRTPDAALSQLRADCATLGIQAFDMYGDYANDASWLQRFQAEVAARLGFNRALFVPSGVMAQNIALKVYEETSGRHSFAARYNSHLFLHEHDAYKHVLHLDARVLPASAADVQAAATFSDVKAILESDDLPAVLFLELPEREIGGKCIAFDDLVRISEAVRAKGIALHMDGARLWEAEANYAAHGHSLHDVTALFDSVYVSFYKGLGAITGAMLLGSNDFIDASKVWLRRFGGNLYSQLPYAASSWAGFRAFPASVFAARRLQLRTVVAAVSAAVPSHVVSFDPPVPEVPLVHVHLFGRLDDIKRAQEMAEAASGVRCFVMTRPFRTGAGVVIANRYYFEMNMGVWNLPIPVETWVKGWTAFAAAMADVTAAHS